MFPAAFLLFVAPIAQAQDHQLVEQLQVRLAEATDDTVRAMTMAMICFHLTEADPDSARWYGEHALELAQRTGNITALGAAWNNLGWLDVTSGRFDSGEARLEEALKIARQLGSLRREAAVLGNLGSSAKMRGDRANALRYYLDGLRLNESAGDSMGMANSLYSVGIIYSAMRENGQALEYLEAALALAKAIPWPDKEAVYLTAIANAKLVLGDTASAMERYQEALVRNIAHGRMASAGYTEVSMGTALKKRDPGQALGRAIAS